ACLYVSLVLGQPPATRLASALFPYTTLFRSLRLGLHPPDPAPSHGGGHHRTGRSRRRAGRAVAVRRTVPARPPDPARAAGEPGRDRKSTRLHSSHVSISYAVFCLTKKSLDRG